MDLLCTMHPVTDLEAAAEQYLSIGFHDVARPDQDTVLLSPQAGGYVEVMLERHPVESHAGIGPVFRIDDVEAFHADHSDLDWMFAPVDVVSGKYALFRDQDRNPIRVVDFRDGGRFARLFRPSP